MNYSYNLAKDCKKHSIVRVSHIRKNNEKAKDEMRNKNLLINFPR